MAKVGKKPEGEAPKCVCGCGQEVNWLRGRGWSKYVWGHHIRINNPNNGDHTRGDRNPMKQPEIAAKISGDNHWRRRPENAERAAEYAEEQRNRMSGENNPGWKGGQTISEEGRVMIRVGDHYKFEHRLVVEQHIGRKLTDKEIVHHKNGNLSDNRIENLELMEDQSEHASYHNRHRKIFDPNDAPFCVCGCGKQVTEKQRQPGRWNLYASKCTWKARYTRVKIIKKLNEKHHEGN